MKVVSNKLEKTHWDSLQDPMALQPGIDPLRPPIQAEGISFKTSKLSWE